MKPWTMLLAALVLGVGLATPAAAETESATDESGDVDILKRREHRQAKKAPFADIVGVTSSYWKKRLLVKARFVELASDPGHTVYLGVDLHTEGDRTYLGQLMYSSDGGITPVILIGDGEGPRECSEKALEGRANERTSTLTFVVPSYCLRGAEWVQTSVVAMIAKFDAPYVEWRDDARMGYRIPTDYQTYPVPVYGPKIARG